MSKQQVKPNVTLVGEVDYIKFESADKTFYIFSLLEEKTYKQIACKGNLLNLKAGSSVTLHGDWLHDPKWGKQFVVVDYQEILPSSIEGVVAMLSSGILPFIRHSTAQAIATKLDDEPEKVYQWLEDVNNEQDWPKIRGLSTKRLKRIRRVWGESQGVAQLLEFLSQYGVTANNAVRIWKEWGGKSLETIKSNPYDLTDIWGFGWAKVDTIALKMGIEADSPMRIMAGIDEVLKMMSSEGHVYSELDGLLSETSKLVKNQDKPISDEAILAQVYAGCEAESENKNPKFVNEDDCIYRFNSYRNEVRIAEFIKNKLSITSTRVTRESEIINWDSAKETFESMKSKELGIDFELTDEQFGAVQAIFENNILVITGGAGVGKSTIVEMATWLSHKHRLSYDLAAPTGKAAKRLSEVTKSTASTVHRMLEARGLGEFARNKNNPIHTDIIIVDEFSMVDQTLMAHLTNAVKERTHFILIGDPHQLPSVGAGNILHDTINSGTVPTFHLTKIFRQASENWIVLNSQKIREGNYSDVVSEIPTPQPLHFRNPVLGPNHEMLNKSPDCFFTETENGNGPEKIIQFINYAHKVMGFNFDDICVLSPMRRRGNLGSDQLNVRIQEVFNPQEFEYGQPTKPEKKYGKKGEEKYFRLGDRVMQISNNYQAGRFNGMSGKIVDYGKPEVEIDWLSDDDSDLEIDENKDYWHVEMDDGKVHYVNETELITEFVLSYSMSIHKSQGSEYPCVILVMTKSHWIMLNRQIFYTGLTRAKQTLFLVGDKQGIQTAIKNDNPINRRTKLAQRLQF